jgi:prophage DNA circulation protein
MDVLSTLQECSLSGISFPAVTIDESFSHDTPQHKSMDRDGAFIENTGRNPFVFVVAAPFYARSVSRGKNETWDDLYPTRFEQIRKVCINRTTTDFVHPLYGTFRVKVTDWRSAMNGDERGGQTANITLVETRDDGEEPAFKASTKTRARSVAADLDAQLATLNPPPVVFTATDEETSFTAVVQALSSIVDSTSLQAKQALAKIDRTVAKLDRLARSLDRGASVLTTDALTGIVTNLGLLGAGSARIWTNCQVLKATLHDIRSRIAVDTNRTVSTYVVPAPTTLVALSIRLKATTAELLTLNPALPRARLTVPAQTIVTYYVRS